MVLILKVSSTETGHIFGTIVYENSSTAEKTYINLNDIHMDIMDYIKPASCTEEAFRSMWAEFEWENKVMKIVKEGIEWNNEWKWMKTEYGNTNIVGFVCVCVSLKLSSYIFKYSMCTCDL